MNEIFSNFLYDSIIIYNLTFYKISDFTKFFFSNFLLLSLFNIQFHLILVEIFDKLLLVIINFFNIKSFNYFFNLDNSFFLDF